MDGIKKTVIDGQVDVRASGSQSSLWLTTDLFLDEEPFGREID